MLAYNPPVPITGESPIGNPMSSTMDPLGPNPRPIDANSTITSVSGQQAPRIHHIWIVTGPAGCGKTTVAEFLSTSLNLPYLEGDAFHSQANIDRMANNIPLEDADRWDWLISLREESLKQLAAGSEGVVLTCSALKRKYRDVIRVASYFTPDVKVHFIYLHAPEALLLDRVGQRQGHYMGATMVRSQFEILEPPTAEETDVISVDVSGTREEVCIAALRQAENKMREAA
ncbi:hypothetical protein NPX13_g887 [Xylaria arbuscula]|uniref:Gluconokinase n=1 Tax=Xylaria arbuscula TaxID=114810 RepID=A0A9W8TRR4_9PEZI|nr:hypothetical protein NPX13_g887 [Xylaria arbuscula]